MGFFDEVMQGYMMGSNPNIGRAANREAMTRQEQEDRENFLNNLMGRAAQPAQYEQQTQQMAGPMMPGQERPLQQVNQQMTEATPGSGALGGNMSPQELALRLMSAPTQSTRATGGNLLQQLLTPQGPGRAETAIEFFQRDPEAFAKMKSMTGPMVKVDTGMKFPEGRMLTDEEAAEHGLSTNASYWLKGDGSAPQKVGDYSSEQVKSANYANQMSAATSRINEVAQATGFDPSTMRENMSAILPETYANFARSPSGKVYKAAEKAWLNSYLRAVSGATVTEQDIELEGDAFFPRPGDTPKVIMEKEQARAIAMRGLMAQSGGAYDDLFNPKRVGPRVGDTRSQELNSVLPQSRQTAGSTDAQRAKYLQELNSVLPQVGTPKWNARYKELMDKKAAGELK